MNYLITECRSGMKQPTSSPWKGIEFFASKKGRKLGFKLESGDPHYRVLADWAIINSKREHIINEIKQRYSQDKIIQMARTRGYSIITNRTNHKGQIEIVLRKVA
jgi:hypothetical protein